MSKIHLLDHIFSSIIHGTFLFVFLILLTFFFAYSYKPAMYSNIGLGIFVINVFLLYCISTLYHSLFFTRAKKVFALLDQSAIFTLIAGTYTPFLMLTMKGNKGIILLSIVWIISFIGILLKNISRENYRHVSLALYIILGWLSLIIGKEIYTYSKLIYYLLFIGGISYTLGIYFFLNKKICFHHTLWHCFVVVGTLFHTLAVISLF